MFAGNGHATMLMLAFLVLVLLFVLMQASMTTKHTPMVTMLNGLLPADSPVRMRANRKCDTSTGMKTDSMEVITQPDAEEAARMRRKPIDVAALTGDESAWAVQNPYSSFSGAPTNIRYDVTDH